MKKGFTVVELLIVTSLVGIIISIGIGSANYYLSQNVSELNGYTREAQALIQSARQSATSVVLPAGCDYDSFEGYGVTFAANGNATTNVYCDVSLTPTPVGSSTLTSRYKNITSTIITIRFKKNTGETYSATSQRAQFLEAKTSKMNTLCVTPLGKITTYAGNVVCP